MSTPGKMRQNTIDGIRTYVLFWASQTLFYRLIMGSEYIANITPDLPPEHCHYRDEGCELACSCLNCPFPGCIYDEPGGRQRWLKGQRDGQIVKLFSTNSKGVKELAVMFGISERTVQRALKRTLSRPEAGREECK